MSFELTGSRVGGAQGIGAATVGQLYELGAHVFFGDWHEEKGRQVEQEVKATKSSNGGSVYFTQVDVRVYAAQLALFDAAHKAHGRVDVAISCAAVTEPAGWFEPEDLNLETVRKASFAHHLYWGPLKRGVADPCLTTSRNPSRSKTA